MVTRKEHQGKSRWFLHSLCIYFCQKGTQVIFLASQGDLTSYFSSCFPFLYHNSSSILYYSGFPSCLEVVIWIEFLSSTWIATLGQVTFSTLVHSCETQWMHLSTLYMPQYGGTAGSIFLFRWQQRCFEIRATAPHWELPHCLLEKWKSFLSRLWSKEKNYKVSVVQATQLFSQKCKNLY